MNFNFSHKQVQKVKKVKQKVKKKLLKRRHTQKTKKPHLNYKKSR